MLTRALRAELGKGFEAGTEVLVAARAHIPVIVTGTSSTLLS
jgi:hypothetical protein